MRRILPVFAAFYLLLLIIFSPFQIMSQERTITGVIIGENNNPLSGVTVTNRTTNKRTQTNNAGAYSISAVSGNVLTFSFVGYALKEITVGNSNVYSFQMTATSKELEEVTISQGIRRQSRALGYSTQKVNGEDLTLTNRDNFLNSMQGRVAGAIITPTSGVPGASAQIILRGPVSFDGNNQPLFVIDGLPISNKTISQGSLVSDRPNRDNDYTNRAVDINPEDIENVTVLTGPEAAALYGTDGASGVILITTKKAKAGATRVTYNTSLTHSSKPKLPEIQQIYDQGINGVSDNTLRSYFGPKYAAGTTLYDNRNNFFENAFSQKHDVSIEGGTDKLSFRFSPSFARYNGVVPNTKLDRTSIRLSVASQISTVLKMDASFNYINSDNIKGSKGANSYYLSLLSWPSDDNMKDYLNIDGSKRKITTAAAEVDNPFWDVNRNVNRDRTNRLLGNFSLTYSPLRWLSITGRVGTDIYTTDGNRLYHPQSTSGVGTNGLIENYIDKTTIYNGNLVANMKTATGKFHHNLSIGANFDYNKSEINSYKGERFYTPNFNGINNTDPTTQRNLTSILKTRKHGLFGNYLIDYDNILFLSFTGRLDASSNLLPQDPYFFYPGAGLSFIFSELTNNAIPWLSYGKLKANVGTTGKDPRRPYLTNNRLDPSLYTGGGFYLNVTVGNPALRAEFTNTIEFGTELKFLNDRLGIDFTYYMIKTKDQITAPRLSYGTGGVLAYLNSGSVENKGLQIQLSAIPVRNKNFRWNTIVNFNNNRNKVLEVPAGQKTFYISDSWLYAGVRGEFEKGRSISALFSNYYRRNINGDVLISPTTGLPSREGASTFKYVGDRAPDFTMGFVNSFTYKNFRFQFVIDTRKGGDIFNGTELYLYTLGLSKKTLDRENSRIISGVLEDGKQNTSNPTRNTIPINPYYNQGYYNSTYTEEDFVEREIDWIRMQDISIGYTLPSKLFVKNKVVKGVGFGLSAANLFLITNYTGVDPSVSGLNASVGGFSGNGIDYGVMPTVKTFTFNLNVRF